MAKWHQKILQTAISTGQLVSPTGRIYKYKQYRTDWGEVKWPETTIKNYLVQGLGADLMMLYRIQVATMMRGAGLRSLLISSVHDSIVCDCPESEVPAVLKILFDAAKVVPQLFEEAFGVKYNLPFKVECQVGSNMKDVEEVKEINYA